MPGKPQRGGALHCGSGRARAPFPRAGWARSAPPSYAAGAHRVHSRIRAELRGIARAPTLAHQVHQRTGGNPLFVLALVDHWKTTSAVGLQADGWRAVADLDERGKGVPESLTAMIHQKMD